MEGKIKGVNLGAWLVLEKWMTPRLFDRTPSDDEYYLAYDMDPEAYEEKIKTHRATFITEGDFVKIASAGFNVVRIPVPYFIFGDREPFIGCLDELDLAFNWARAYGLEVLIDLHTAPYSQNAFDNGGISGVCKWAQHPEEVEFVLNVLTRLAERYKADDALYGIEVLNEPLTPEMWDIIDPQDQYEPRDKELAEGSAPVSFAFLYDFYQEAYDRLREILPPDKAIVFHDGFDLLKWEGFFKEREFDNVMLDTHHYLMFGNDPDKENLEYYQAHLNQTGEQIEKVSKYVPVVTGEWCLYNQQIVKNQKNMTDDEVTAFYNALWQASVDAWNKGDGYFYWTYKLLIDTVNEPDNRGKDAWDVSRAIARGWAQV
ncbi:Aryl-phospho-beta-D-glucosidase BglC, GH1 family [Marinilactibacillus piezotolerans]|uniref:Exo-1,3-beta-glucanase D n=1 Tax=Marinilactibacillus piezotolerans TaxID=258723 RepID=A0A1I4BKP5_9LACT|nr:cellulase family glycosylhydrolase [Marinilactibacillus piezotolerans]SFK68787.1 Aryl-phospho-beta-D-glucosidase BglC, GH1 family [Marinilactibacillus piezotolerans]